MMVLDRCCVASVVKTSDGFFAFQQRDETPGIEYPGWLSLFAGRCVEGEAPDEALFRELNEELYCLVGPRGRSLPIARSYLRDVRLRPDRPWWELIYVTHVDCPSSSLAAREGAGVVFESAVTSDLLARVAPHHASFLAGEYVSALEADEVKGYPAGMTNSVAEYVAFGALERERDFERLEGGPGFAIQGSDAPIAVVNTQFPARFVALLEFLDGQPRGNHYHHSKIELMTVLRGELLCEFYLPDSSGERLSRSLGAGEFVRIAPGCVHTFTAKNGNVTALEYGSYPYEDSDTTVLE